MQVLKVHMERATKVSTGTQKTKTNFLCNLKITLVRKPFICSILIPGAVLRCLTPVRGLVASLLFFGVSVVFI
jgi:hypothetical protein